MEKPEAACVSDENQPDSAQKSNSNFLEEIQESASQKDASKVQANASSMQAEVQAVASSTQAVASKNEEIKLSEESKDVKLVSLSLRIPHDLKEKFNELKGYESQADLFIKLINNYINPPEPKVITKEIPVATMLAEGFDLQKVLNQDEKAIIETVIRNRYKKRLRSDSSPKRETPAEILKNAFFTEDRLVNRDCQFYTGLQ